MIHGVLGEGEAVLEPLDLWDSPGAPARSAAELIAGLNASLSDDGERAHQLYAGFPG
jgi:hypothetical protein